jgi:RNA polymerase sigma-70 factor, ECF subfamily
LPGTNRIAGSSIGKIDRQEVRGLTQRLLQKAKRGNADAFTALCAPYANMVYRHCLQMLKNAADAQEAAQEAMLRAFRAIEAFEGNSELATWLFKIAHNVSLDFLKKAYRQRESASLDEMSASGYDPPAADPSPEDAYVRRSEQDALREAVSALPVRQQTLLSLRYGDSYSYEQIAKAMNLSLGTVKSALNRAKEDLRAAAARTAEN